MQQLITREQLWERLGQLDPFQQQSVVAFIDSLLKPKTLARSATKADCLRFRFGLTKTLLSFRTPQNRIIDVAKTAAKTYRDLRASNHLIEMRAIFIASTALTYGLPLMTQNTEHFGCVGQLQFKFSLE